MDHYTHTIETWDKVAERYQEYFMDMDLYNDTYDAFCNLVGKTDATIFEIGCGPGNITRYLLSKRPDFQVEAIDVAPSMINLARQNVPDARFSVMDCRDIDTLSGGYDGILCGFCMPYLSREDCVQLIRNSARLLVPGGAFYCSVIEGDYATSGYETSSDGQHRMYVYLHQEDYLKESMEAAGLKIVQSWRKEYTRNNGSASVHLILMATK
jgi:SAM-dependent methyltransferase